MKLALLPPISMLSWALKTEYQLMLPQLLETHEYELFYKYLCQNPEQHVILDNGAAEGEPTSAEELVQLVDKYGPDELVLPDVLEDGDGTVAAVTEFFDLLKGTVPNCRLGVVAAGKDRDEAYRTVLRVLDMHDYQIDVIYIPRSLVSTDPHARLYLASDLQATTDKQLHCLGANPKFIGEMELISKSGLVRGMDTSAPFNYAYAMHGVKSPGVEIHRPAYYFDLPRLAFHKELTSLNVDAAIEWSNGNID